MKTIRRKIANIVKTYDVAEDRLDKHVRGTSMRNLSMSQLENSKVIDIKNPRGDVFGVKKLLR